MGVMNWVSLKLMKKENTREKVSPIPKEINSITEQTNSTNNSTLNINIDKGGETFYSILSLLLGKELADKFNIEDKVFKANNAKFEKLEYIFDSAMDIYGISANNLKNKFYLMKHEKFELIQVNETDKITKVINRLQLLHIYIGLQNTKVREAYIKIYSNNKEVMKYNGLVLPKQLVGLLNELTDDELNYADMLQQTIQEYYPALNAVHVRVTGLDLNISYDYFPMRVGSKKEFLDDIKMQGDSYAYEKVNLGESTVPFPMDVLEITGLFIAIAEYYINVFEKFTELRKILFSKEIKEVIENIYGKDNTNKFEQIINRFSLEALIANNVGELPYL
jgi:regulator of sigma D